MGKDGSEMKGYSDEEYKKIKINREILSESTLEELKLMLRKNLQTVTGTKE